MQLGIKAVVIILLVGAAVQNLVGVEPTHAKSPPREVKYLPVPCKGSTAADPWTATKIWIRKDRQFIVQDKNAEVVGQPPATQWSVDPAKGTTNLDGFPGWRADSKFLLLGADVGCLIGKVNDQIFALGHKSTLPGNVEGYLYLAANDKPGSFADNTGAGDVMIIIERP